MARYMTTAESVSELTGTSVERSQEMLEAVPLREMARLTAQELAQAAGLTGPQSCRLAAALALGAKLNAEGEGEDEEMFSRTIRCPEDIAGILAPRMEGADQEELHALYLNTRNRVTAHRMVYRGNVNSSVVRTTEVHRPAVVCNLPGTGDSAQPPRRGPGTRQRGHGPDEGPQRGRKAAGHQPPRPRDHRLPAEVGEHEGTEAHRGVTGIAHDPLPPVTQNRGNGPRVGQEPAKNRPWRADFRVFEELIPGKPRNTRAARCTLPICRGLN